MIIKSNKNFFTFLLTSFLLGVVFSHLIGNIDVNKYLNNISIEEENTINADVKISDLFMDKSLDLTLFWRTYNIIKGNYYNVDGIKNEDLINGITKGLIDSLGDRHTEFMTPDITKVFEDNLSGDFEGIGAVIEEHPLGVEIDRILKGSPSEKFGLLKGDVILKSGDIELKGMNVYDAVDKIKGPAGTKVELKILREGEDDFIIKEVIRSKIKIPSIDFKLLENNIGYISINVFGELTSKDFKSALSDLEDKGIDGLIIDLRNNGGGYLESSVEILSNFIENGKKLVVTKYRDNLMNRSYLSENNGDIYNGKIVVLINGNSASASEITAGALKDYSKAIIVGEKSYGKGSVQQPFDLGGGNLLKLTIAKWFTPNDINIDGDGIEPDIEVTFKKEDYTPEKGKEDDFEFYDRQLEESKKILLKYIDNNMLQLTVNEYKQENGLVGTGTLVE